MVTFIVILLILISLSLTYAVWNLLQKLERYEDVIAENTENYIQILNAMKEIDSNGAFQSDDEVGTIFTDLKTLIEKNKNILSGK
jgi:hypothetical protein